MDTYGYIVRLKDGLDILTKESYNIKKSMFNDYTFKNSHSVPANNFLYEQLSMEITASKYQIHMYCRMLINKKLNG